MSLAALFPALVMGLALAADAFAAALCQGVAAGQAKARPLPVALTVGLAFGVAQGVAPLLGWLAGAAFSTLLAAYDHWIAFVILAVLGVRLIGEGLQRESEDAAPASLAVGWTLAGLAVATSIDAAAAGVTLPTLGLPPLTSATIIGVVTFAACAIGVLVGRAVGDRLGGRAEILGGAALIAIGLKVLVDHGAIAV